MPSRPGCRSPREASFNVYNFTRHEPFVYTPAQATEDLLVASVSLPMWFEPVRIGNEVYIASVFNTDANLGAPLPLRSSASPSSIS